MLVDNWPWQARCIEIETQWLQNNNCDQHVLATATDWKYKKERPTVDYPSVSHGSKKLHPLGEVVAPLECRFHQTTSPRTTRLYYRYSDSPCNWGWILLDRAAAGRRYALQWDPTVGLGEARAPRWTRLAGPRRLRGTWPGGELSGRREPVLGSSKSEEVCASRCIQVQQRLIDDALMRLRTSSQDSVLCPPWRHNTIMTPGHVGHLFSDEVSVHPVVCWLQRASPLNHTKMIQDVCCWVLSSANTCVNLLCRTEGMGSWPCDLNPGIVLHWRLNVWSRIKDHAGWSNLRPLLPNDWCDSDLAIAYGGPAATCSYDLVTHCFNRIASSIRVFCCSFATAAMPIIVRRVFGLSNFQLILCMERRILHCGQCTTASFTTYTQI